MSIAKGYKLSETSRQNISEGHKGKPRSFETREKISLSMKAKGITRSLEAKARLSIIASNRKLSEETKAKISDAMRGDKHPNWKGGVTYPIFALRKTKEYRHWRNAVLERDGYRCRRCYKSTRRLNTHHIFSFTLFPELRFEVSNGLTVCVSCHTKYKDDLCQLVLV